jgi:hypothetical protein
MGTIPAPNIAQDAIQIAQMPQNAMAEYARTAALQQQMRQQQQAFPLEQQQRQQQVAQGAAQTQMIQQQAQDQMQMRKLAPQYVQRDDDGKPNGFDTEGYYNGLLAAGVPVQTVQGERMKNLEFQKGLMQLNNDELKLQNDKNNQAYEIVEPLRQHAADPKADINDINQTYQKIAPRLLQLGIKPQDLPASFDTPQHMAGALENLETELGQHKQMLADAKTQAETAKDTAAASGEWKGEPTVGLEINTKTGETRPMQGAAVTPQMQEAKYIGLAQKRAAGQPLSPDDAAFMKGYEKFKTLVPVANFNLQNSGAAVDQGGNPSEVAKAIANGQMAWKDAVSPRTPQSVKNQILSQVFKINPNFDTAEFGLEQDAAKKARSGQWADTRLAYNTAIDHAQQLLSAADALGNGDTKKLNSLKNYFSTEFGSPDVTNFNAIANAYNHEVTSVISKGHITDAEVAQGHASLPDNASPAQIRGVAQAYLNLMTSKRDELNKIIKSGAGNKANSVLGTESGSQPKSAQGGAFSWDNMPQHQ